MRPIVRIAIALERIADSMNKPVKPMQSTSKYDAHKNGWTKEEDDKLRAGKKLGLSWEEIAKRIPGRTQSACSTRYSLFVKEEK